MVSIWRSDMREAVCFPACLLCALQMANLPSSSCVCLVLTTHFVLSGRFTSGVFHFAVICDVIGLIKNELVAVWCLTGAQLFSNGHIQILSLGVSLLWSLLLCRASKNFTLWTIYTSFYRWRINTNTRSTFTGHRLSHLFAARRDIL